MFTRRVLPKLSLAATFFATMKTPSAVPEHGPCPKFFLLPNVELTPSGTPAPSIKHVRKRRRDFASRLLIVGDVHGCLAELKQLVNAVKTTHPGPLSVIAVGDLVNKGPSSVEVLDFCEENSILSVRGNHEKACLDAVFRLGRLESSWKKKYNWTQNLNEKHVEFLCDLPYSIMIEDTSPPILVVHAGLISEIAVEEQELKDLITMRQIAERNGILVACEKNCEDGVNWTELWHGPEFVFYGHDAKRGLNEKTSSLGLDTGVVYGNLLTGALIEIKEDGKWTYELVEVPAQETWCAKKAKL